MKSQIEASKRALVRHFRRSEINCASLSRRNEMGTEREEGRERERLNDSG